MKTTHLIPPVSNRCFQDPLKIPQQEIYPATQLPEINTRRYLYPSLSGCQPVPHRNPVICQMIPCTGFA